MLCLSISAKGQSPFWSRVPLPNIYFRIAPYFLTQNTGFVYDVGDVRVQSNLRKTTDGGNTWQSLPFFDNANALINQLYFTDLAHGYAATTKGVYETPDSGITWRNIYPTQVSVNSVYAFQKKVFAYCGNGQAFIDWGPFVQSSNDGAIWDTILQPTTYSANRPFIQMTPYVCGNRDGTVITESTLNQDNMALLYSTNNGTDWSSQPMDIYTITFSLGFFCYPHCNDILRTYISFVNDPQSDVFQIVRSSDFGKTWDKLYQPVEIGAWIAGNNCVQYVSNADITQTPGLMRSTDLAKSWTYISGPDCTEIDDGDFHNISVVGGGAVVYAGDHSQFGGKGALWKTTTGGDGTLSAAQFPSPISMKNSFSPGNGDTLKIQVCDTGLVTISFENLSCNVAIFDSLRIDGLDNSEFSTVLIHHLFCDGLPDTLLIKVVGTTAGVRNITVHPQFINDEYETIDTSFSFPMVTTSATGTSIYLKAAPLSLSAADTAEIPLYINNVSSTPITLGLDSIELTYALNTDLISPFIFVPSIKFITADRVTTTATNSTFTLHFPPGFIFSGETELGKLKCEVYLSDTMESGIALTGNANSTPCENIASNSTIHFSLATHCGDSSLSKFIKYGPSFTIMSIVPNPARNEVSIELKNDGEELRYQLFDALGISRKNGIIEGNSFLIDLSKLSEGVYYLRVGNPSNIAVTKGLIIEK